jgi:hypothetical protein
MWCHERKKFRPKQALVVCGSLLLSPFVGSSAAAETPPPVLKVSGKAALLAEARTSGEGFEVRGTLTDEVGRPLAGAEVRIRTTSESNAATLHRCGDPRGEAGAELLLTTDKSGRVCTTVTGMPTGSVELSYQDARGYLERTTRLLRLPEGIATSFEVGFDPPLTTLLRPIQRDASYCRRARAFAGDRWQRARARERSARQPR